MSGPLLRTAPMRFLIGVAALWTMARGIALVGWGPLLLPGPETPRRFPVASPSPTAGRPPPPRPIDRRPTAHPVRTAARPSPGLGTGPAARQTDPAPPAMATAGTEPAPEPAYCATGGIAEAAAIGSGGPPPATRWSGSAWLFLRGGGRATLLSPGQVGGGQAGGRIFYRLGRRVSASARASTAIGGVRQSEAAIGIDWQPIADLPLHLGAERRIALDRGGRNAWTLGAAGGLDDLRPAPGWRLDVYGEAGMVGGRRRDLYADGAARIGRTVDLGGGMTLAAGGGAWGAAQPGAARLDAGPAMVLRLPVAHHRLAVALDWRERVLGHARPGPGLALTAATDF